MQSEGRALLAAAALACAASGCAAGPAPADRFYRLDAGPPPRTLAAPSLPGTLLVTRLRADGLVDGRALLYRRGDDASRIHRHAYDFWVEPPTAMLQTQLAAYLRAAGAAERVATPEMRLRPDFVVSGRVQRFERVLGRSRPGVEVEVELFVTRETDRQLLLHRTYRVTGEAGCDTADCSVSALGRAVGTVFERFLADTAR